MYSWLLAVSIILEGSIVAVYGDVMAVVLTLSGCGLIEQNDRLGIGLNKLEIRRGYCS